jgi:hypothetical protein
LVDECRDLSMTSATQGNVTISTEIARQRQEDGYRISLPPGSSVTYRVDGPIDAFRVYTFGRDAEARLELATSADGSEFEPLQIDRWSFPTPLSVYGYLTPVLYEARLAARDASWLQIRAPSDGAASPSGQAPLEISRVEIEFDRAAKFNATKEDDITHRPAPVNSTIFVAGPGRVSDTLDAIDRAAARGERRLNVCVTIFVDLTDDLRIKSYGIFRGPDRRYQPFDDALRAQLKEALRPVFARLVERKMEIFILPHIDSNGAVDTWRNWVDFDPRVPYAGYSYEKLMIDTIAEALEDVAAPDSYIELALSGEMGTSLFRYPQSYQAIVDRLRKRSNLTGLKIGISLNHGGIAGSSNPTGAPDIQLSDDGRQQMQRLLDNCDFVGMSFYRPVRIPTTADDFVRGIAHFMGEFDEHGLKVPTTTPLHFSEVGIGGGHDEDDVAPSPEMAAATPWAGSGTPRVNPWQSADMQALRRQYHRALVDFLHEQPAPWRVSAAFFWSTGSWDPLGLRHAVFADPEIRAAVERHNRPFTESAANPALPPP